MGSIPARPDALNVPLLLCQERFNEASLSDMKYEIIGQCSILSNAAFRVGRPRSGSGLAATLPRLCCPNPGLAEPLGPDLLRLGDRHHPGAASAVAAGEPLNA